MSVAVKDPFSRPHVAIPDTVELRGPADADHFRVKVGRYGDRFYTDPLEADTIAPTSEATFPSVSTCKKASGSDWSFVALKRVSTAMDAAPYNKLADWKPADRYEGLKAVNKNGLNAAAQRSNCSAPSPSSSTTQPMAGEPPRLAAAASRRNSPYTVGANSGSQPPPIRWTELTTALSASFAARALGGTEQRLLRRRQLQCTPAVPDGAGRLRRRRLPGPH